MKRYSIGYQTLEQVRGRLGASVDASRRSYQVIRELGRKRLRQTALAYLLTACDWRSLPRIAQHLRVNRQTARATLAALVEAGVVQQIGESYRAVKGEGE